MNVYKVALKLKDVIFYKTDDLPQRKNVWIISTNLLAATIYLEKLLKTESDDGYHFEDIQLMGEARIGS